MQCSWEERRIQPRTEYIRFHKKDCINIIGLICKKGCTSTSLRYSTQNITCRESADRNLFLLHSLPPRPSLFVVLVVSIIFNFHFHFAFLFRQIEILIFRCARFSHGFTDAISFHLSGHHLYSKKKHDSLVWLLSTIFLCAFLCTPSHLCVYKMWIPGAFVWKPILPFMANGTSNLLCHIFVPLLSTRNIWA